MGPSEALTLLAAMTVAAAVTLTLAAVLLLITRRNPEFSRPRKLAGGFALVLGAFALARGLVDVQRYQSPAIGVWSATVEATLAPAVWFVLLYSLAGVGIGARAFIRRTGHRRVTRIGAIALAGVLVLGTAAIAGGVYFAGTLNATGAPTSTAPKADYQALMLEARRDFDAMTATLVDASGSERGMLSYLAAKKSINLEGRLTVLRSRIASELPTSGAVGEARKHYLEAASLLERSLAVFSPYLQSTQVRDLLHRAEAEWRKGDDLLK